MSSHTQIVSGGSTAPDLGYINPDKLVLSDFSTPTVHLLCKLKVYPIPRVLQEFEETGGTNVARQQSSYWPSSS